MSLELVVYDARFAAWQMGNSEGSERRMFEWGADMVIHGNEVTPSFKGVSKELVMLTPHGGGPTRVRYLDEGRYPNQGFSCVGCPFFGVDGYGSGLCAHPLYLELYGCPQSSAWAGLKHGADPGCPMLGLRSEAAQRRTRWHHKSHKIFWEYYHEAKLNPWMEGFRGVYPFRHRDAGGAA